MAKLIGLISLLLCAVHISTITAQFAPKSLYGEFNPRHEPYDFEYFLNGMTPGSANNTFDFFKLVNGGKSLSYQFANDWPRIAETAVGRAAQGNCFRQLGELVAGLGKQELSSYKFFDSWGKIPSGMLKGHLYDFGNFDECVDLKKLLQDKSQLVGKYCFAKLPVGNVLSDSPVADLFTLNIAVCMPAACTAREFDVFFKLFLQNLLNIKLSDTMTVVNEHRCSVRAKPDFTGMDWFALIVFIMLGVLMVLSSLYDFQCELMHTQPDPLLNAFSMQKNLKALLAVKPNSKSPNVISCLNGIRCLSLIWVVCGHTFVCLFGSPTINSFDVIAWGRTAYSMFFQMGPFAVDSFFFLSGLLVAFIGLRDIEKNNGKLNVPMMYVHRLLRLTPMLALAVLYTATLSEYMANAPLWPFVRGLSEVCKDKWWSTLLYVQNYVNVENMCFSHAWYLAVDTQLYFFSPIFLLALWKWKRRGVAFVCIVALLFVACIFSIIMVRDYSFHKSGLGLADEEALNKTYYSTQGRTSAWFVGILLGYMLHHTRSRRVVLHKPLVAFGWIMSFGLLATVLFAFLGKARNALPVSTLEEAFYWSLARVAWPLALAWIVFACVNGYGGPIDAFLSCPLWQPLARLSFSIYIWHMVVEAINSGRIKTNPFFSNYDVTLRFWGDFGWAIIVATAMHLALEAPLVNIERILLRNPNKAKLNKPPIPAKTLAEN